MSKPQQTMINRLALVFAIASLFCWNRASNAQAPPTAEAAGPEGAAPAEEVFVLRTYDVGDLVITVRDYPYPGSMKNDPSAPVGGGGGGYGGGGGFGGGGGGGYFSVPGEQQSSVQSNAQSTSGAAPRMLLCQFGGGDSISDKDGKGSKNSAPPAGSGKGEPARPLANGTAVTMDDLLRVLTNTVAADTWEPNGGQGRIDSLGTALIVWQTPRVQQMVEGFLKQIRETSGHRHTLTIDARWLMLTSDELDSISAHPPAVDPKALATFTRRPGTIRGITNCFSGQLVYVVSGTKRNVVTGWIPVVGSIENLDRAGTLVSLRREAQFQLVAETFPARTRESSVGYQAIVETPNFGALLEIRPTTMGDSDVIVELKSTLTAPSDQITERSRGTAASDTMAPAIDRIAIETQELATTMRIPAAKPVLVGGMTYVPGSAKPNEGAKSSEHPQLYLVLEIR